MWRLQPKNHVLAYSLLGHLCVLFFLLFALPEGPIQLSVNNPQGARVVCVPAFMLPGLQQKQLQIKQAQGPAHKSQKTKAQVSEKKEAEPKTVPQKQKSRLATTLFQHTTKKRQFSTAAMAPKQIVQEEPVQAQPEVIKKEEKLIETHAPEECSEKLDSVIYVDKETYASMQIAQELQQAIAEQWAPPAGVPSHISCDVQIELNAQGKAQRVIMIKKSGIAAYDMAARTALLKTVYPKMVLGRTVVVHFDEEFACGT